MPDAERLRWQELLSYINHENHETHERNDCLDGE
jgi:hypothetical protein